MDNSLLSFHYESDPIPYIPKCTYAVLEKVENDQFLKVMITNSATACPEVLGYSRRQPLKLADHSFSTDQSVTNQHARPNSEVSSKSLHNDVRHDVHSKHPFHQVYSNTMDARVSARSTAQEHQRVSTMVYIVEHPSSIRVYIP